MAIQVSDATFNEEVLKSDKPVLVDFWASWCGPCMMMTDIVEEISKEMEGKVKVCKVNVDENQQLALNYGIMSIPNFIVFKNGEAVSQAIGATSKENLLDMLK